jgi:hypothetical protein
METTKSSPHTRMALGSMSRLLLTKLDRNITISLTDWVVLRLLLIALVISPNPTATTASVIS